MQGRKIPVLKRLKETLALPVRALIIGFLFALPVTILTNNLVISLTDSDGYRVFWRKKCEYTRGEFVSFIPPGTAKYAPEGAEFIKKLYCMPGDEIERKGRWFFCNGKRIAYALEKTRKGQPLEPWLINNSFTIPEGYYFVKGENVRSYDSRYYGLISKEQITGCYRPLF